jgi:hypothetical protein
MWAHGSFYWQIPNRFRVISDVGYGAVFAETYQTFLIEPSGRTTITKAGAKVERSPS